MTGLRMHWGTLNDILGQLNVDCVGSFFAFFDVEFYAITFVDTVNKTGCMYEVISFGYVCDDETKSFGLIEELDSSCTHIGVKCK